MRHLIHLLLLLSCALQASELKFSGLETLTQKELTSAIYGRLEFIKDRPATSYRADDAAFLVQQYLHSHGLPDARVDWSLPSDDVILLTIKEGMRQYLGTIEVQGSDDSEEIIEQFREAFPESGKQRAFLAQASTTGLAKVQNILTSKGYWDAKLSLEKHPRDPSGSIPITIHVDLGELYRLGPAKVNSQIAPSSELQMILEERKGIPASSLNIKQLQQAIEHDYHSQGFSDLSLRISHEKRNATLLLTFELELGKRLQVHSVNLAPEGVTKTDLESLQQHFDDSVGGLFDENDYRKKIKKLLSTGAFEQIRMEKNKLDEQQLEITLHLVEADARGYHFSLGGGSYEGFILGAQYYDHNFDGRLWNLSADAEFSSLGLLGEVSLTNPFFLDRDLSLHSRAFLTTRDYANYEKAEGGFSSELSWEIGDYYSASLSAHLSYASITSGIPAPLLGATYYTLNRLEFSQTYDRRNHPALPSDGWLARLHHGLGLALGRDSIGYFETSGQLSYYQSVGHSTALSLGLRGGLILPTGTDPELPIDLRKFLGGAQTVRSFPEREMGPQHQGRPLGGTEWWVANAEIVQTISGPIKGVSFLDLGSLSGDIEIALGLGVRLDLPIGPVRIEYGHNMSRDEREPSGTFHFALGISF